MASYTFFSLFCENQINSKYLIGHLGKSMRPLVLIMHKMNGYVKTFKVKEGDNKLKSFLIDDEKI